MIKNKSKTTENETKMTEDKAFDILDRIIGFVGNCDNKASIVLGIYGVVLTMIFTSDGMVELKRIILAAWSLTPWGIGFIFFLGISLAIMIMGLYMLLTVLTAKINCDDLIETELDLDSKIFFGSIAEKNTYIEYKKKLLTADEDTIINDIVSQIYLNSVICNRKFKRYNLGVKLSIIGLSISVFLWIGGSFCF